MKISDTTHRLKELMDILGLTQSELARRTGLDKSTISYYVNGKREPMQDNIMTISLAFNLDPAWLMGYEVPMYKRDITVDYTLVTERYNSTVAETLNEVKKDETLQKVVNLYQKLSPERKQAILNLIESMGETNGN